MSREGGQAARIESRAACSRSPAAAGARHRPAAVIYFFAGAGALLSMPADNS